MNRRNFFGVMAAVSAVLVVKPKPTIKQIDFAPPKESPAILWSTEHVDKMRFAEIFSQAGETINPSDVKHGWSSRKLSGSSMYLSDSQEANFLPITYWIRPGHELKEVGL